MDGDIEKTLAQLFRVHKTLIEMLSDRGYIITNEEKNMTMARFKELYKNKPDIREAMFSMHTNKNDPTDKVFIFVMSDKDGKSIAVKDINLTSTKMKETGVNRSIIVYRGKVTTYVKNALSLIDKHLTIELFLENELLVNVTRHNLVPQHIVLNNDQKKQLFEKYKVNEAQLPRILKEDPVTRYFGLKRLQVFKIIRDSETAGRYVTYRVVW